MALDHLLDFIKVYTPSPVERASIVVRNPSIDASASDDPDAGKSTRKIADSEPLGLFVFKTMTDPFAGRITFFKVIGGVVKNDATLENYTRRGQERFSHLSVMQGRKAVEVPSCTPETWVPWPSCAKPSPATPSAKRAPTARSISSRSPSPP